MTIRSIFPPITEGILNRLARLIETADFRAGLIRTLSAERPRRRRKTKKPADCNWRAVSVYSCEPGERRDFSPPVRHSATAPLPLRNVGAITPPRPHQRGSGSASPLSANYDFLRREAETPSKLRAPRTRRPSDPGSGTGTGATASVTILIVASIRPSWGFW